MTNLFSPEFDPPTERPGFVYRRARLGRQVGAEHLGLSLYELEPRQATFPYHCHLGNEELLIVVSGAPHLRTADGWRGLTEGDVVSFPRGESGAHQLVNRSEERVRFLLVSEMNAPDVSLYPDSGKVGAHGRAPGAPGGDAMRLFAFFRLDQASGYWEGEQPPASGD